MKLLPHIHWYRTYKVETRGDTTLRRWAFARCRCGSVRERNMLRYHGVVLKFEYFDEEVLERDRETKLARNEQTMLDVIVACGGKRGTE